LPADVAAALAEIELALRRAAEVEEKGAAATAVVMLPHAARGLILTFFAGAGMEGLPTETATVVRILDALDDELRAEWGENAMERTAAGSRVHRTLVESLASTLAGRSGTLTHADGLGTLPEPPRVGRHQPDLAGRAPDGSAFIGEAKLGPELFDIHSQEQLADFSTYAPDGERCALHLIVPAGWRDAGERAMITAAGRMYDAVTIHELGGIPGAPLPPAA
jgi:hypothetical protein